MKNYRRSTSCWLISQALCFCLLFQGTGIAEALPLSPDQTFLSEAELEAALANPVSSEETAEIEGEPSGWLKSAWSATADVGEDLRSWARSSWSSMLKGATLQDTLPPERVQLASASGFLPLPSRLLSVLMASTGRGQAGPPGPPGMASDPADSKPPVAVAGLMSKDATEGIQLLAGYNLISIPEEPADPAPSAVFADIAADLARVEAYDACDLADPWKLYDPADPAASDLTVVDHKIGMWVKASAPALLPSDGTLSETTTLQLCQGWNLIGFPAGQPRHPEAVLAPIAGKWERLFGYDVFNSVEPWEVYDRAVPAWVNNLQLMHPGRGYWLLASEATTLEIRNQGPPPTVAFTSPADLAVITEPTEIIGTVESDLLESWTLTYREFAGGDPVTLVTSNSPVSGGTLATFDPTLLLNGLYELELTATDVEGQQVSESIAVSVEGQMKIGHFTLSFVDLAIPVSGLDIEVVRTYDSRDKQQRDFGVGWRLDIRQGSYVNNRPPGDGWQLQTGFLPCDTVLESKSHLTVVRLSDLEVYRFALRLANGVPSTGGGCFAEARFDFIDGPVPGATLEIIGSTQVFWENDSDRVIDVDTLAVYEPEDVRLTTRDGRIFELDLKDGVTKLEELNGNELSLTPAGITHSSGKGIVFERDSEGRIARITDALSRSMSYAYDSAGDLRSFTDRAGALTRFTYDSDHRLLDIENALGIQPIRNEYDPEGRLVRHIDAFGKVVELGHDLANRREIVTDRLGHSRVMAYDARGNAVREIDALGQVTQRVFDSRDNLLSETDPLGRTTSYVYTANNDLESVTDPLSNKTSYLYNEFGQELKATDPRGGVTASVYDSRGNLTQTTDALGSVTTFAYDAAGHLLVMTDALGQSTTYEYDAFGNRLKETDALGYETSSTYDAGGNLLSESRSRTLPDGSTETLVTSFVYDVLDRITAMTAADGSTTEATFDLLGKVISRTDAIGRVTTMAYDSMGRHIGSSYPDGTHESQSYDAAGQLVGQVDRAGRTTTMLYDGNGRLLTTVYPDLSTTSRSYGDAGQLVSVADRRGNTTSFAYDAAGRRTVVVDALGNETTTDYDANGNQTAFTDAKGAVTAYAYDALNRVVLITYPDSTTVGFTYDALGRRTAEIDQTGTITHFGYDTLGRLATIEDALGHTTAYTYDEIGNRRTQNDASGHRTTFEHDSLGRQTARILPDGSRESRTYDAVGLLASHTGFDGATRVYAYDVNRRLIRRGYPDGSEVTFTYTPTGQRSSVTTAHGTTSYVYDTLDRLLEKTDPTGNKLSYAYDLQGNRTRLTATIGGLDYTTMYTYDALDRLATVTDPGGGVTVFGYNEASKLIDLEFPNKVTTNYSYDALDRLTDLGTVSETGQVLQDYSYDLGLDGRRNRIDEYDGTSRLYQYDALGRVLQEEVKNSSGNTIFKHDFNYDAVGNWIQQSIEEDSTNSSISYNYDDRDRLLTAASETFSWNVNGELINRGDNITYQWDGDGRLTRANLANGTIVDTAYDADGNRIQTQVILSDSSTSNIEYVVDTAGALAHVVAELVDGEVSTVYSRAEDRLLSLLRPQENITKYYHADGLGSIRLLSDDSGGTTDRYTYTAFGTGYEYQGNDPNPYRFASEPFDSDTNLSYNRARWLDLESGRFLSMDPLLGNVAEPVSLHRYLYANANPVSFTDPTGEETLAGTLATNRASGEIRAIAVLSLLALTCVAAVVSGGPARERCTPPGSSKKKSRKLVIYRGIKSKPKNVKVPDFKFDDDGLSAFELPTPSHSAHLPFIISYAPPKIPGVAANIISIGGVTPPIPGGKAYFTPFDPDPTTPPGFAEIHWSIRFEGDLGPVQKMLQTLAKQFLRGG